MPRYRVERRGVAWICDITLENDTVVVAEAREGQAAHTTRQVFASPAEAKRRYVSTLAALRKERATPLAVLGGESRGARDEILEEEIRRDPESLDAYLVYADWLQLAGDPRGELITLQIAREQRPKDRALQRRERELLGEQGDALLGPLRAAHDASDEKRPNVALGWRRGFWRSLLLASRRALSIDVVALLQRSLQHASARFLDELVVGPIDQRLGDFDPISAILLFPPPLRRLRLGQSALDPGWIGGFDPRRWHHLLPRLPGLRELVLEIDRGHLTDLEGPLQHDSLELFDLSEDWTSEQNLSLILDASWPVLVTLRLAVGPSDAWSFHSVRPILDGERFPRLRHLALRRCTFSDAVCRALPTCALLPRLETLDLSDGGMTDEGAAALAAHRPRLRHLRRLSIQRNQLSQAGLQLLRNIAAEVVTA